MHRIKEFPMKNLTGFVQRQLIARGALLLCIAGGLGVAHAQTASPGSAPSQSAPSEAAGMGHGMGGMMGGMGHGGGMGGMDHGGKGGMMGGMDHGGGMSGMSHGGGGGMMKDMMCGFAEHLDARLAYLKTELKLTEQQTPHWNAFADAWRTVAQNASTKCAGSDDSQKDEKQGVLGKLSILEAHMVDHLDIVRAQKAALEPLFALLSDDQKKAANETLTRVMNVGMSMGGGGMGHGMGGMNHGMGGMDHGGMDHGSMGHGGMDHGGMGGMMGGMSHGGMQH
jgi:hypothetical protein